MKKNRRPRINGTRQEFEIVGFGLDFKDLKLSDKQDRIIDFVNLDPVSDGWNLSKIKRGTRLVAMASKGRIKYYGKRVVTHILSVLEPVQVDLVDFIAETNQ